tara:strand:+ start:207 stop:389 length:183 start_codon:yes stop_codon:yes gene_type:complete
MVDRFSIDEILSAVEEINNKKLSSKKITEKENNHNSTDYSMLPKDTLQIIEQAEKSKKKV